MSQGATPLSGVEERPGFGGTLPSVRGAWGAL
jgi:hypothetical protein